MISPTFISVPTKQTIHQAFTPFTMTTKPLDLSLDNPIIMDTHSLLGACISAGHGVPNSSLDAADDSINHQAHYAPTIFTINNTTTHTSNTNNSITVPLESNLRPETRLQHQLHHLCRWNSCGQMFGEMEELVSHVNERHVLLDEGEYCCKWESCSRRGKGFNARYKMLIHVRTHTNEKPHQCPICGKSFSRLENLKIHNRSHTGERPYVCPVAGCNKRYSNSSDRFKHTRTHLEEKPYFCKVTGCDKRYTDPSSLRKHVKTFGHYASRDHLNHYITQKSSSAPPTKPTARISPTKSSPVAIFPSVTSVPPTSNVSGLPEGVIVYPILVHSPSLQPHYSYVTLPGHLTDFAGSTTSAISVAGLNNNDTAGEDQRSIKEEGFGLSQDSVSLSADIKS